jgi:hypothetical protein
MKQKNKEKRLDARRSDYHRMLSNSSKTMTGFKKPGSNKK